MTIKEKNDFGIRLDKHLPLKTNDPAPGFFLNGVPAQIDPRATVLFHIPGYNDGVIYPASVQLPEKNPKLANLETKEIDDNSIELDVNYTWNTWVGGKWGDLSGYTSELRHSSTFPSLSQLYRNSNNKRVWFGPWETYFLLAEAHVYGWNVPGSAQSNYEAGVKASFEYHGILRFADQYLASEEYNPDWNFCFFYAYNRSNFFYR